MRVHLPVLAIIFFLMAGGKVAVADLYREAVQAESEGVPEVSVTKLRQFLAGSRSEAESKMAKLLLAKCLLQILRP